MNSTQDVLLFYWTHCDLSLFLSFTFFFFFGTGFRYASLYFCCCIEEEDNELLTLEIIHRYVELLDKYFGNVSHWFLCSCRTSCYVTLLGQKIMFVSVFLELGTPRHSVFKFLKHLFILKLNYPEHCCMETNFIPFGSSMGLCLLCHSLLFCTLANHSGEKWFCQEIYVCSVV